MAASLPKHCPDVSRRPIAIFDTSIASSNIGDDIIMEAVSKVVEEVFGAARIFQRIATHQYMSVASYWKTKQCELGIVGGTNLLGPRMARRGKVWRLTPLDIVLLRKVVLLGVGWGQRYEEGQPDLLSKLFLKSALSSRFLHSVRDEYTLKKLSGVLKNVIFTGCPTLWSLTPAKCRTIPTSKASAAIVSLSFHTPDERHDEEFIGAVKREYDSVYLWCQQRERDVKYAKTLAACNDLPVIDDLRTYDRVLETRNVDVIGTRLHGGIRALQFGRRALILTVDVRATEMGRSANLPVVDRADVQSVRSWIHCSPPVAVRLPSDAIAAWKQQFAAPH